MLECALVRAPVIIFLLFMLAPVCAPADIIHLKNGRTIWADQARENGAHVEYNIGDNSYAIQKSAVERIESGGVRQGDSSSSGNSSGDMPAFAPTGSLKNEAVVTNRIIHDDKVDVDALAELQKQSDLGVTAAGYFAEVRTALAELAAASGKLRNVHDLRVRSRRISTFLNSRGGL